MKFENKTVNQFKKDWKYHPAIYGTISAPVIAYEKAYIALTHEHQIVAVDIKSGKKAWIFTAGGRIDTPPTIYEGYCLFGCRNDRSSWAWRSS